MADHCLLYYITDRSQFHGDESGRQHTLLAKIAEAACARVDYIQLREKDLSTRALAALASAALAAIRDKFATTAANRDPGTRLLINSRTDVAMAVGAAGVHLRADDVTPADVRQCLEASGHQSLIADDFLIAASCHNAADVARAESEEVDFAIFAPVFGKSGVTKIRPTGLAALRDACRVKLPVLALGGVTVENAALCLDAGAAGVAGIRLFQENRIEDVVRSLRAL
jgi:thiamine-phosphate pyrophosphorylase